MHARHQLDEQLADRRCHGAPKRSGRSPAAEQTDPAQRTAGTLSVELSSGREHHQDITVLTAHGEIDLGTAPVLREALLPVLEHQTGPVVVDLSEVAFIDSTAVHVLVETLQRLNLENRRLAIACREGGQVHRVLGLVGLLDTMAVYRSLESAVTGGDDLLRSEAGRIGSSNASHALITEGSSLLPPP